MYLLRHFKLYGVGAWMVRPVCGLYTDPVFLGRGVRFGHGYKGF